MKDYDISKELLYLKCLDVNNLYGWAMSQKLPVDGFKWVENKSQFHKDVIENYSDDCDEGYFLDVHIQCPENQRNLHIGLPFCLKEWKLKKLKNLWPSCTIKTNILYT